MDNPNRSLNVETNQNTLIPKQSMGNWKPDEDLNIKIKESWGLEKLDERPAST